MRNRTISSSDLVNLYQRRRVAKEQGSKTFLERRAKLLAGAASLFAQKEYEDITIGEIAEAAGISRGSLYYYFASKDEILAELLHDVFLNLVDSIAEIKASEWSAAEKLAKSIQLLMGSYAQNYPYQYWYLRVQGGSFSASLDTESELHALAASFVEQFVNIVRDGIEAGEFKAHGSPEIMARGVLGMVNATQGWYRPDSGYSADDLSEIFSRMVLDGVR